MALESVTYVGDLTATNPTSSDPKSAGDDHIRNIKSALRESFAGFAGAILVSGTDGGSANTYTLTPTTALVAYAAKMVVEFTPNATNTGASTLNISALGAVDIVSVSGVALVAGDLVSGCYYLAVGDGSQFRLLSTTKNYVDQLAFSTALPSQTTGDSGKYVKTDGTNASWAGIGKTIEVLTSGTSWVCPAGVFSVKATVVGGGGGGARVAATSYMGGGGGGCAIKVFTTTPGDSYTYAIGAAGAAAATDSTAGSNGGNSTFNTGAVTVTGGGGTGGLVSSAGRTTGGTATNGDLNIRGGYGAAYSSYSAGHGGDSALGSGGTRSPQVSAQGYGAGGAGNEDGNAAEAGTAGAIVLEY